MGHAAHIEQQDDGSCLVSPVFRGIYFWWRIRIYLGRDIPARFVFIYRGNTDCLAQHLLRTESQRLFHCFSSIQQLLATGVSKKRPAFITAGRFLRAIYYE